MRRKCSLRFVNPDRRITVAFVVHIGHCHSAVHVDALVLLVFDVGKPGFRPYIGCDDAVEFLNAFHRESLRQFLQIDHAVDFGIDIRIGNGRFQVKNCPEGVVAQFHCKIGHINDHIVKIAGWAVEVKVAVDIGDAQRKVGILYVGIGDAHVDPKRGVLFQFAIINTFDEAAEVELPVSPHIFVAGDVGIRNHGQQASEFVLRCRERQIHIDVICVEQLDKPIGIQFQFVDFKGIVFQGVFAVRLVDVENSAQCCVGALEIRNAAVGNR